MKTDKFFEHIHTNILGTPLLEKANKIDHNANGIQIRGEDSVKKIALGVSCNNEFLEKAVKWGADICLFHHGLPLSDWGIVNSQLSPFLEKQLKTIIKNNITVAGYHYSLDVHEKIGNNAQIIQKIGAKKLDIPYYDDWGWVAEFENPVFIQELANECSKLFRHDVFMVLGGSDKIKRVGVCSGGARMRVKYVREIQEKNINLHLTGEISETNPAIAKESGFNYFSCGHYATEVFGIKALGEKIKQDMPQLEVKFIDVWNEL